MIHKEITSLAEKGLPCKECGGHVHVVTDLNDPPPNIKRFIIIHCAKGHFREIGWHTDPKDMKDVLEDLINKWNEANA